MSCQSESSQRSAFYTPLTHFLYVRVLVGVGDLERDAVFDGVLEGVNELVLDPVIVVDAVIDGVRLGVGELDPVIVVEGAVPL